MNAQRVLDNFLKLVQIDSPSGEEKEMALELKAQLEALGMEVYFDDSAKDTGSNVGNLIAHLEGTGPGKLALSSHMDTVSPGRGIKPVVGDDGIIRSEGDTILAADDKSGVAAIIEAISSLREQDKPYPSILVTFTVKEETGLEGAKFLSPELFADNPLTLVADGSGPAGTLTIGAPFNYKFEYEITGKAAHAGVEPEKGISAITVAARAISAFDYGRIDEESTANIGLIEGGRADNIVAQHCKVTGECRSLNFEKLQKIKVQIQESFQRAALEAGAQIKEDWDLECHGYRLADDDPNLDLLREAGADVGIEVRTEFSGGASDANVIAGKGANSLVIGTGMTNYHTTDECIKIVDLENTARFIEAVAYRVSNQAASA